MPRTPRYETAHASLSIMARQDLTTYRRIYHLNPAEEKALLARAREEAGTLPHIDMFALSRALDAMLATREETR